MPFSSREAVVINSASAVVIIFLLVVALCPLLGRTVIGDVKEVDILFLLVVELPAVLRGTVIVEVEVTWLVVPEVRVNVAVVVSQGLSHFLPATKISVAYRPSANNAGGRCLHITSSRRPGCL